ncbi:metallophosphoesterase [Flavicella sediminum]|uniref:metallophosphoesterase n=1 Tax=Flavicella sediminum TaxID=2585141 RepID=UPI00111D0D1D|nr:metallophosphoesterase [Flavicella sediminum]
MIRIIHISDFHLEKEEPSLSQKEILKALILDIKQFINDEIIIIFSGDLVDKSGLNFLNKGERFKSFKDVFLDKINDEYPSTVGRIFIVPGNHDFDRTKIDGFLGMPFRNNLVKNPEIVGSYIESVKRENKNVDGLLDYKNFEKEFYNKCFNDSNWNWSQFDNSFIINNSNASIGISCFNSSWLCYEDENVEKLFISDKQIESSLSFIKDTEIKIAVMHHPLEFYHKDDLDKIKALLYNNYHMVFVGHTHKLESKQIDDLDGNLFLSVGKSISGIKTKNSDFVNGYSVVDYLKNDKVIVRYKKYLSNKTTFVINTDIGNDQGIKEFQIPKTEEIKLYHDSKSIIDTIKCDHFPKLNDDLILNISQSNKSKLSEIFVEPIIGNLPESNLNEQNDIKYFTTNELANGVNNILLFGAKETGKTILLDKLLIDLTENYKSGQRLPVLIKFGDIRNKSIFQKVRDFILKSSEETRTYLTKIGVVLLIDNIDFDDDHKYSLKELKMFLDDYPKTKIIATHAHLDEAIIPLKVIEEFSHYRSDFSTYYLHFFKSKQIKGLMSNWVSTTDLDLHQNIEKLLRGFNELGLPKTPLAVTLFLWIINKQQKKPINNAVLVELFVDNLLEKSDIKNIYFETFDFDDKQRLLAFISKYMLDEGNRNLSYRVNEFDLLKEIEGYLKLKMDINPNKLFDYFIDRGILTKCNGNSVRFKTAFFFSYFLAKYMSFDTEFREDIFRDKNYLNYLSEIDFYTGLNREDDEVFDFINKELTETFSFINPKVRDEYENIDEVLETEETITSRIDLDKVKEKPSEKEIEDAYDSQLSSIKPNQKIEPKQISETKDDDSPALSKILKLASVVLKNSTDIAPDKRKIAYDNIILSSMSFMLIYRDFVLFFHKHNKDEVINYIPKKMSFGYFMQLLPLIHQVTMYNWIGSLKSAPIIRQKILEDQDSVNISEFEKFLSVYIYSDIRGKNHVEYIDTNFKNSKRRYILDNIFFKNMSYYYLRSKTQQSDLRNTKLLADIKVKLRDIKKSGKGRFIQQLKDKKNSNS